MSAPTVPLAEVEWRVDGKPSTKDGKTTCRFVPYIDALWVSQALDEWIGTENWQDDYEVVRLGDKDAMLCRLSLKFGPEWVCKTDVGAVSNFEGQKGAVTDAFKRCASRKWGVGRNVYDLPTLWAPCRTYQANGKEQAAPNRESLPAIMRELKSRGYSDAEGGKVLEVDPDTGEITDQPDAPANGSGGERACLVCKEPIGTKSAKRSTEGYSHTDCVMSATPNTDPF